MKRSGQFKPRGGSQPGKKGKTPAPAGAVNPSAAPGPSVIAPRPFKRRPRLFASLLIGFAIWIGLLLMLYFKTVYPLRYGH